jgi:FixJ family two-component response regulator
MTKAVQTNGFTLNDSRAMYPAGTTLFVVDDDDAVRKSLTRLLRAAGWNVETFASATAFLERGTFSGVGCVLLDLNLPDVNGIELQAHMSRSGFALPVVFLTGRGDIPTSVLAMKQGAVDFLVKPIDENVLFPAIEQAIKRHISEAAIQHDRDIIMSRLSRLSSREQEVLNLVLQGRLNKQIAFELSIAEKTVKVHRGRVMEKMEASTIADLVHMCDNVGVGAPELRAGREGASSPHPNHIAV